MTAPWPSNHTHERNLPKAPPIPQPPILVSRGSNPCTGGGRAHHGHGDGAPQALRQRAPPPASPPHHAALLHGTPPPASWFIFMARRDSVLILYLPPSKEGKIHGAVLIRFFLIWFGLFGCAGVPAGEGGEIRYYRTF